MKPQANAYPARKAGKKKADHKGRLGKVLGEDA
jgi:hypothetical protein